MRPHISAMKLARIFHMDVSEVYKQLKKEEVKN